MITVDFYYSLGSRYSYLAATQIVALEEETGASVIWLPVAHKVLQTRRGFDPYSAKNQVQSGQYDWKYRRRDAENWADFYGVPFLEPVGRLKVNADEMNRGALAAERLGSVRALSLRLFTMSFVENRQIISREDIIEAAVEVGIGRSGFRSTFNDPATLRFGEKRLREAEARGVFGVPSFFVGDQMFWGQDRLPLVRHALLKYRDTREERKQDAV